MPKKINRTVKRLAAFVLIMALAVPQTTFAVEPESRYESSLLELPIIEPYTFDPTMVPRGDLDLLSGEDPLNVILNIKSR